MNALAVPEPPKLSTCARDGHHEGFDLGIRYYPAFSPQKRWVPMEVLPTLKKRTKKKRAPQKSYTHTADNLVDRPTIHTVINRLINRGTVVNCSLVINADIIGEGGNLMKFLLKSF